MKSREGVSRNILVQNQFKIKQSVLLYLLSASSVQSRCLITNVKGIQTQLNFDVLEWMTQSEQDHIADDVFFVVQDGSYYDLGLVGINKHVPDTQNYRILEYLNPKTHRLIRFLSCKFNGCGKVFRRWHNFFDHLRTHTKERPYQFNIEGCNIAFTQKANLDKHMVIHKGIKKFECQKCQKSFYTKFNLNVSTFVIYL